MKKLYTFILLIAIFGLQTFSFSQSFQWAKTYGGTGSEDVNGVSSANDANGNIYVTGFFSSATITFGSITLNNAGNTAKSDMYLAKYNSNGAVVWAKNVGGTDFVYGRAITQVNWPGVVFVAGAFKGSVTFGTTTLTASGTSDMYLVQYDGNGNVLWATQFGGTGGSDNISKIDYSNPGIVLVGTFQSPTITFGSTTLTHTGTSTDDNGFVARYDSIGCGINTFCWAKSIGGSLTMADVSSSGNNSDVCITGSFYNPITFGATTLTSVGSGDIFIAKYDVSGNLIWAKREGGANDESGTAIIIAPNSTDIYLAGNFGSTSPNSTTTTIGSITLATIGPDPGGFWYRSDLFLAKLDGIGNVLWAKGIHGIEQEEASDIISDPSKNVFVVGNFSSTYLSFGTDTIINTSAPSNDIYVTKYDPNGNFLWVKSAVSSSSEVCDAIARYGKNFYIIGSYSGSSITFDNTTITSNGGTIDMFLAKLYDCATPAPSICTVTVDSLSQNNVIVWDKTPYAGGAVDSFIIYREVQSNIYKPLGAIPYSALSMFVDTFRTKYFIAPYFSLGDPNAGTYRYKLQVHDTCGTYSALSPYHNTIFMTNNSGTFSWPQLYTIEGSSNPVTSYYLMRDNNNTGNWNVVNSVTGTQQSVTDPQYATYQSTGNWRVETNWSLSCTPTIANPPDDNIKGYNPIPMGTINTSKSNTFKCIPPSITIIQSGDTLSASASFSSYSWSTGATTSSIMCTGNGTYSITVTNAVGCTKTASINVTSCTTGITDIAQSQLISVFPNPSTGKFEVRSGIELKELEVCNMYGEIIYSEKISNHKSIIINLEQPSGIYFLKIISDKGTVNKKIILQ